MLGNRRSKKQKEKRPRRRSGTNRCYEGRQMTARKATATVAFKANDNVNIANVSEHIVR